MEDRLIRPSMKTVYAAYALAIVLFGAAVWAFYTYATDQPPWIPALALIFLIPPLKMHLSRRMVTLRLHDDHLTLERGFLSRTRRTVDMGKIQDVTVHQTFRQRMLGVGDLMLESAGESGAMSIQNLDRPRQLADSIIESSKRSHGSPRGGVT